jgi:putative FmdB family regulatory protein
MPMYEFECPECKEVVEHYHPLSENVPYYYCDKCERHMVKIFSPPTIQIFQEYTTNNIMRDGSPVTVRSSDHERRLLKDNGLIKADAELK